MNDKQKKIADQLRGTADIHTVAARLIARESHEFILWRSKCAATLAVIFGISLNDAKAVVGEMTTESD